MVISVQSLRGSAVLLSSQNMNLNPTFKLTQQLQLYVRFDLYEGITPKCYG